MFFYRLLRSLGFFLIIILSFGFWTGPAKPGVNAAISFDRQLMIISKTLPEIVLIRSNDEF